MSVFSLMGLLSTIALSLPIIVLFATRLVLYRSFPALFAYYFIVLSYLVLLLGYVDLGSNFQYYFGVLCNFLDTPLMLLFLAYFSKTVFFRRKMLRIALGFMAFELIVLALYGFNIKATTILLAPGILLVLIISVLFFTHQVKIAVMYHRAIGKAVMVSSVLVSYVGFAFVYAVYYIIEPAFKNDAHLVYFLIITFSSLIMAAGIFIERKRVNQLSELQTTREELKAIYGGQQSSNKIANPLEPAIMKFDQKDWN